ncbi:MAG: methyltransferase domain-containing protein [Chloroflexota bacterium]|nr:methyltransferase domain-containing protein [Chloroflexota bacterium]
MSGQHYWDRMARVDRRIYTPYLPRDKDARILDAPCGFGRILYSIQRMGYRCLYGIDTDATALETARLHIGSYPLLWERDIFSHLGEQEAQGFDCIHSKDFVEHLTKDELLHFLDLIHASLRPGGTLIIQTVNGTSLFGARMLADDLTHEILLTPRSLRQALAVTGFEVVTIRGIVPAVIDILSLGRRIVWEACNLPLRLYITADGAVHWQQHRLDWVLEQRILVVGRKPCDCESEVVNPSPQ